MQAEARNLRIDFAGKRLQPCPALMASDPRPLTAAWGHFPRFESAQRLLEPMDSPRGPQLDAARRTEPLRSSWWRRLESQARGALELSSLVLGAGRLCLQPAGMASVCASCWLLQS